jgi:hypothetical protein
VKNKFRKKEEAGLIIHDGEKTGRTFRLVRYQPISIEHDDGTEKFELVLEFTRWL